MFELLVSLTALMGAANLTQATADLKSPDGTELGTVHVAETPNGLHLTAKLENLPIGIHAFHLHETGSCAPDFSAAGGHFNPTGAQHGFLNEDGFHAGDLPNIHVTARGVLELEYFVEGVALTGENGALLDENGAAVVIHNGADDYRSDPAGAAGDRIACGVISP